jgi:hypothetical protein
MEIFRLAVKPLTLPRLRRGPLPLSKREGFSDNPQTKTGQRERWPVPLNP